MKEQPMEFKEISTQLVEITKYMESTHAWVSIRQIAADTGISHNTVRPHVRKLMNLGIVNKVTLYPGYRYRFSEKGKLQPFWLRLEEAKAGFNLSSKSDEP
jgi:DNA-binding Lrp family transcriptional regulator